MKAVHYNNECDSAHFTLIKFTGFFMISKLILPFFLLVLMNFSEGPSVRSILGALVNHSTSFRKFYITSYLTVIKRVKGYLNIYRKYLLIGRKETEKEG